VEGLRQLGPNDLAALRELEAHAARGLPAGFMHPKPDAQLLAALCGDGGSAWGVVLHGSLVAAGLLSVPRVQPGDPAFPRVPARDWPAACGFLSHALVLPAQRGKGLQRALVRARLSHARATGLRWVCAGTHLDNAASWRNLLAEGLAIVGLREDKGHPWIGVLRPVDAPLRATGEALHVPLRQLQAHREALQRGHAGMHIVGESVTYCRVEGS
jgi:GNAT superfamily N-acetyltransferase